MTGWIKNKNPQVYAAYKIFTLIIRTQNTEEKKPDGNIPCNNPPLSPLPSQKAVIAKIIADFKVRTSLEIKEDTLWW